MSDLPERIERRFASAAEAPGASVPLNTTVLGDGRSLVTTTFVSVT